MISTKKETLSRCVDSKQKIATGYLASSLVISSLLLAGCGGGGSPSVTDNNQLLPEPLTPEVRTGVFIDSEVANIVYRTQTKSGITNDAGEFQFLDGETISFSIGGIRLPTTPAQAIITPLNIAETNDIDNTMVMNIVRLLVSLDVDGNPNNGISIDDMAHKSAVVDESFDLSSTDFENDINIINLVANSGSITTSLVTPQVAKTHFEKTLSTRPTANPGENQSVPADSQGVNVPLDGSNSSDNQNRTLSYTWSIVSQPACVIVNCTPATISNANAAIASLNGLKQPGEYVVSLTVNNGIVDSINDAKVTITLEKEAPIASGMFGLALFSTYLLNLFSRRRAKKC